MKPTLLKVLLTVFAFLGLICAPQTAFAQHGGGGGSHGGGGGGFHGGGGGFHSGGSYGGGFHGGGYSSGGYRGSEREGYGGGSRYERMGGESPSARNYGATRGSSSLPRADTSPGWHSFGRSGSNGGAAAGHEMGMADGQWHSFGSTHGATGSALTGSTRFGGNTEFAHGGAWGGWGGRGWGDWGGRGWGGWHGGWGYPGYGFGWGCWACGWGFGFGWGIGWNPYWALYPYPYWDNLWWGDPYYYPPPYYLYPYPD